MESGKHLTSHRVECQDLVAPRTPLRSYSGEEKKIKESSLKECFSAKRYAKPSLIPVLKNEKYEPKSILQKYRCSPSYSKLSFVSKEEKRKDDIDIKLKTLEQKEKSIAEYYSKIQNMIEKFAAEKSLKNHEKCLKSKVCQNPCARKMISDPLVFNKAKIKNDILTDFENNVQQITDIWLKTSADLSNTIKNLRNNISLDSMEFQVENVRIQLSIKRAKSLTLLKARNVLAEAKKLLRNREMIRTELEKFLSCENLTHKPERSKSQMEEKNKSYHEKNTAFEKSDEKQEVNESGDSPEKEIEENSEETSNECSEKEKLEKIPEKDLRQSRSDSLLNEHDETSKEQDESNKCNSSKVYTEMELWARELSKKNETIANLNSKILELQKTCNEHSLIYNQLQIKLSEFHEKIQWNQVLWKQIGKLKEQIKGLQQTNNVLESQKRELECKITRLDQELDKLVQLNHFLNQKENLLEAKELKNAEGESSCAGNMNKTMYEKCHKDLENKFTGNEKIIVEKQNAINQLKAMLSVMREQENFAQKQITVFQSKIEELEKNVKA